MSVAWFGIVLAIAAILGIVGARRTRRKGRAGRGSTIAEELFEGLLPSAMTGGPREPRPHEGWGLRWTDDVTNLTAQDLAAPPAPRRGAVSAAAAPAGEPVGAHPAAVSAREGTESPRAIDS